MKKIKWKIAAAGAYFLCLYLVAFLFEPWFDAKLYRHIAGQFPLLIGLGWVVGYFFLEKIIGTSHLSIHISVFIFFIASLIFWMLPISIDSTSLNGGVDLLLAANLWLAGLLLGSQFSRIRPEFKFTCFFFMSTMIFVSGTVLNKINLLLCGTYTLHQQKILATYLIAGGISIFVLSVFYLGIVMGTFLRRTSLNAGL